MGGSGQAGLGTSGTDSSHGKHKDTFFNYFFFPLTLFLFFFLVFATLFFRQMDFMDRVFHEKREKKTGFSKLFTLT